MIQCSTIRLSEATIKMYIQEQEKNGIVVYKLCGKGYKNNFIDCK